MFRSLRKVTVTLALWAFLKFGILKKNKKKSDIFDDITFLITSNNHMVDDLNTILFMIIGKV